MAISIMSRIKSMNNELVKSEEILKAIINANIDAIIQIDTDGKITGWGGQAESIFGWKEKEALGRNFQETVIPAQYREEYSKVLD